MSHEELGDIHLGFVKGLPGPYAVARAAMDRRIQAEYPGKTLTRDEYHAAAEATLEACACGGHFTLRRAGPLSRVPVHPRPVGRGSRWPEHVLD